MKNKTKKEGDAPSSQALARPEENNGPKKKIKCCVVKRLCTLKLQECRKAGSIQAASLPGVCQCSTAESLQQKSLLEGPA